MSKLLEETACDRSQGEEERKSEVNPVKMDMYHT
jgi:hypothetical protein